MRESLGPQRFRVLGTLNKNIQHAPAELGGAGRGQKESEDRSTELGSALTEHTARGVCCCAKVLSPIRQESKARGCGSHEAPVSKETTSLTEEGHHPSGSPWVKLTVPSCSNRPGNQGCEHVQSLCSPHRFPPWGCGGGGTESETPQQNVEDLWTPR